MTEIKDLVASSISVPVYPLFRPPTTARAGVHSSPHSYPAPTPARRARCTLFASGNLAIEQRLGIHYSLGSLDHGGWGPVNRFSKHYWTEKRVQIHGTVQISVPSLYGFPAWSWPDLRLFIAPETTPRALE
ncbi:hypothetical protein E2P81_ATG10838 [Venturia nashicola]|uniref:Uncharacterized protein n=1 Tax=Venturia nashicola TaxID=86259 RepID=A0A4Z1NPB7_9PEZI|nr:hypothetical protein E6O75_ATG10511 [Venturia nashicola]TLD27550.1 hypothetical protein E2P81_ATG10838 [Venturia nashicola]